MFFASRSKARRCPTIVVVATRETNRWFVRAKRKHLKTYLSVLGRERAPAPRNLVFIIPSLLNLTRTYIFPMRHSRLTVHRLWSSLPSSNAKKEKQKKERKKRSSACTRVFGRARARVVSTVRRNDRRSKSQTVFRTCKCTLETICIDDRFVRCSRDALQRRASLNRFSLRLTVFLTLVDKFDVRLLRMKSVRILQTPLFRFYVHVSRRRIVRKMCYGRDISSGNERRTKWLARFLDWCIRTRHIDRWFG